MSQEMGQVSSFFTQEQNFSENASILQNNINRPLIQEPWGSFLIRKIFLIGVSFFSSCFVFYNRSRKIKVLSTGLIAITAHFISWFLSRNSPNERFIQNPSSWLKRNNVFPLAEEQQLQIQKMYAITKSGADFQEGFFEDVLKFLLKKAEAKQNYRHVFIHLTYQALWVFSYNQQKDLPIKQTAYLEKMKEIITCWDLFFGNDRFLQRVGKVDLEKIQAVMTVIIARPIVSLTLESFNKSFSHLTALADSKFGQPYIVPTVYLLEMEIQKIPIYNESERFSFLDQWSSYQEKGKEERLKTLFFYHYFVGCYRKMCATQIERFFEGCLCHGCSNGIKIGFVRLSGFIWASYDSEFLIDVKDALREVQVYFKQIEEIVVHFVTEKKINLSCEDLKKLEQLFAQSILEDAEGKNMEKIKGSSLKMIEEDGTDFDTFLQKVSESFLCINAEKI